MKPIHLFIGLFFISLSVWAQSTAHIDTQILEVEASIKKFHYNKALGKIDSLLMFDGKRISREENAVLKALKVEALQQAEFFSEALELSNEVWDLPDLPLEYKLRLFLQRELIYEIIEDFKNAEIAMRQAATLIEKGNLEKSPYYGEYLIRKSSLFRVQDKDSLARIFAHKAKTFGALYNYKNVSASAAMLLGFLEDNKNVANQACYYNLALKNYKTLEDNHGVTAMYYALARINRENQEYNKAIKYLDSTITVALQESDLDFLAPAYKMKSGIYEHMGQPAIALANYKMYTENNEKYKLLQKTLAVEQLTFRSEVEKEKLKRDAVFGNLKTEKTYTRTFFILSLVLVLALITLAYLFYRISRKNKFILSQQQRIAQKNEKLTSLVSEKHLLLKELHHRVKNNLSLILSLIVFQKGEIEDPYYKEKFETLNNRIKAVAIVHEQLLQREDLVSGNNHNIKEYVNKIANALIGLSKIKIEYNPHIDSIYLPLDTAVPIGILINELISNSIKYAIPKTEPLILTLGIVDSTKEMTLTYADNSTVTKSTKKGLGMFIIENMIEQLDAVCNKEGWNYTVTIPKANFKL